MDQSTIAHPVLAAGQYPNSALAHAFPMATPLTLLQAQAINYQKKKAFQIMALLNHQE